MILQKEHQKLHGARPSTNFKGDVLSTLDVDGELTGISPYWPLSEESSSEVDESSSEEDESSSEEEEDDGPPRLGLPFPCKRSRAPP